MKLEISVKKIVFFIVVIIVIAGVSIFSLADPMYLRAPSDMELATTFRLHREAFEDLCQMMAEDSLTYVSENKLDNRLTDARISKYKKLLAEIHSGLIVTKSNQSVRFRFAHGGLLAIGPGWMKGIERITGGSSRAGILVNSLDDLKSLEIGGVYLHQIEPRWFVMVQKTE